MPKNAKKRVVRSNSIPSSPAQQQRLLSMIREVSNRMTIAEAARDSIKEAKQAILEEFPITGKLMGKLIRFEHKRDYDQVEQEWQEISSAFEDLHKNGTP